VLATLLGTGKTSRLYARLEEHDQSVTHYAVDHQDRIDPTLLLVRAEIKPSHRTLEVERAIGEEVDRLQQAPVSDAELARAKQLIKARFVLGNEPIAHQAIMLGLYETISRFEYLSTLFARLDEVTTEAVQGVAARYLAEDNRTVGYLTSDGGR
jgi:predicted Zn-dependent peptidase